MMPVARDLRQRRLFRSRGFLKYLPGLGIVTKSSSRPPKGDRLRSSDVDTTEIEMKIDPVNAVLQIRKEFLCLDFQRWSLSASALDTRLPRLQTKNGVEKCD